MTASKLFRRIIQDMRQIVDMYHFVKVVEEVSSEAEKGNPPQPLGEGFSYDAPEVITAKQKFMKKYNKSLTHAGLTCLDTCHINNHYLVVLRQNGQECLVITTEGRELTDTVPYLPFIKLGLYEALWKKHGGFISGVVVGSIPTLFVLVKWAIDHL